MNKYFENILNQLSEGLPRDWKRVILRVIYGENSYDIKYYVSDGDVVNVDCFDLGLSLGELAGIFANIDGVASKLRDSMKEENGLWSAMTLVIDYKGHVKADFVYEDVNENLTEYRAAWKKKYLA